MNNTMKFLIKNRNIGERIDIFLSKNIEKLSRSSVKKLIKKNYVHLNNVLLNSASVKLKKNDKIVVNIVNKVEQKLTPSNIKLNIIFEDKDILLINKPKGMVVHPGAGNFKNTLSNALIFRYKDNLSNINGSLRPGIVHRIDKDTSGLLVVAKNNFSHSKLSAQFSNHSIKRNYKCLIWGVIRPLEGRIETLISRSKKNRQLMTVSDVKGKKAITNYKTIQVFNIKNVPKISLIDCELETGRTHQIRVHLNYKGSSILGDKQYGKKNIQFKKVNEDFAKELSNLKGQALHAETLEFLHPTKSIWIKFKSSLPSDFRKMLNLLKKLSY